MDGGWRDSGSHPDWRGLVIDALKGIAVAIIGGFVAICFLLAIVVLLQRVVG